MSVHTCGDALSAWSCPACAEIAVDAFGRVCTCGAATDSTAPWPCPSHPLASQRRASPYGVEVTAPALDLTITTGVRWYDARTPESRR